MKLIMSNIVCFFSSLFVISCNSRDSKERVESISQWIVSNQEQINLASDSIIADYYEKNKVDSNWTSSSIAITKHAPGIFRKLAEKAGDSTECVVIELTFYNDPRRKRSIMIASEDATCINKLDSIILETDSTESFIFGKKKESIY